jgi:hypothetical protein
VVIAIDIKNSRAGAHRLTLSADNGVLRVEVRRNFLARTVWTIATSDAAVRTTRHYVGTHPSDGAIPNLTPEGPLQPPNLEILFAEPQQLHQLSWWPPVAVFRNRGRSRSRPTLNGFAVRVRDAEDAVASLSAAGVVRVDGSEAWLTARRQ